MCIFIHIGTTYTRPSDRIPNETGCIRATSEVSTWDFWDIMDLLDDAWWQRKRRWTVPVEPGVISLWRQVSDCFFVGIFLLIQVSQLKKSVIWWGKSSHQAFGGRHTWSRRRDSDEDAD